QFLFFFVTGLSDMMAFGAIIPPGIGAGARVGIRAGLLHLPLGSWVRSIPGVRYRSSLDTVGVGRGYLAYLCDGGAVLFGDVVYCVGGKQKQHHRIFFAIA